MGFLGTIPADKLSAFYDITKHKLILYAAGEVMGATYGFNFQQNTFMGGLKFTLQAWTGPLTGKQQKYEHQQAFQMLLPSPAFPSGNVIIVTANHPTGIEIPIRYSGIIPPTANAVLTEATAAETTDIEKNAVVADTTPGHTQLNVLFKTRFNISANAHVPTNGSVTITYDAKYVQQIAASIYNNEIVWTFFASEMGDTEITVTTSGGIATYIMIKTYDVKIFVL